MQVDKERRRITITKYSVLKETMNLLTQQKDKK